jgi:hypothetical protein
VDLEGGSGADLTKQWLFLNQTCKNTKKGIKCNIKSKLNIQNIGTKDAVSSVVRFYLSDNDAYDAGDIFLKKVSTGKLKLGKSVKKTFAYNFKIGFSATGKYVIAVLDADNKVIEAAEGNNKIVYGPNSVADSVAPSEWLFTRQGKDYAAPPDSVRRAKKDDIIRHMPTVLRVGAYRLFFYAGDRDEPPHIHVERNDKLAKFWLDPVRLQRNEGFSRVEISRIHKIISENESKLMRAWNEYFGS